MEQSTKRFDTTRDHDERYQEYEGDANMILKPEFSGTRRINVAIVGIGRMGSIHLHNILREPRANLCYVVDADENRLDFVDKKYFLSQRGTKILNTKNWQVVLDDTEVEAILIATPTFTHEHYVKTSLESNKHVLVEKPLAESLQAVDSLVKLAFEKNLKLLCAFNRRYDPSFRYVAEQIRRGNVGKVRLIKTCCRDSPLPPIEYIKISGGIFHDCAVHDIDVILWYANELPIEVHAYAHVYMDDYKALDDFDTTVVCMKFDSGLMSITDLSRIGPTGYEQRAEVYGPKGIVKLDEMGRTGWEIHTDIGVTKPSQCYSFVSRYAEAYANEITELFNHIEGNKTMHQIKPGYLQAVCKIVQAVEESARSGKVVALNWTKEEIETALDSQSNLGSNID